MIKQKTTKSGSIIAIIAVLSLVIIGSFLRSHNSIWGENILFFNADDYHHFGLAGLFNSFKEGLDTDLTKIFFRSYLDAHPPLRNIILNLILRFTDSIYSGRLLSLIPGVMLIPTTFYLAYKCSYKSSKVNRFLIGFFFAFLITFMDHPVNLSMTTRPYMLMLIFQFLAAIALISYIQKQRLSSLSCFFVTAFISLLTDYSALMPVTCFSLVMILASYKEHKWYSITGTLFLISLMSFQAYQMYSHEKLDFYMNLRYLKDHGDYISSISQIPTSIFNTFSIMLKNQVNYAEEGLFIAPGLLCFVYILGLYFLFKEKKYYLLILALGPILLGVLFALFKVFPITGRRHCVYLILSFFISYIGVLEKLYSLKLKFLPLVLTIVLLGSYLINIGFFENSLTNYYQKHIRKNQLSKTHQFSEQDLFQLHEKIQSVKSDTKYVVFGPSLGHLMRSFYSLKNFERQTLNNKKPLDNSRFRKHYCVMSGFGAAYASCEKILPIDQVKSKSLILVALNFRMPQVERFAKSRYFIKEAYYFQSRDWFIKEFQPG